MGVEDQFWVTGLLMHHISELESRLVSFHFVAIRFDRDLNIISLLEEIIKDNFFESRLDLELEFTKKAELKVYKKPKKQNANPLLFFPCVPIAGLKKMLTFALLSEVKILHQ